MVSQRECTFQSHQLEDSNLGKGTAESGTWQTVRKIIITPSCIRSDTEEEYLILLRQGQRFSQSGNCDTAYFPLCTQPYWCAAHRRSLAIS